MFAAMWFTGYTQTNWQAERDSILRAINNQKEDSNKVITLITAGSKYEANNPDSAIYYYRLAGALANRTAYHYGTLRYLACMIEIFETQAKFDSALQFCLQGIALSKSLHNRHAQAAMYNNAANIYSDLGQSEKVLEYYQYSVEIYEQLKSKIDTYNLAIVYGNILAVYASLEQHDKAYDYGLKAVALSRTTGENDALLISLINLSDVLIKMKHYDTAMLIAKQVTDLAKKINDYLGVVKGLGAINEVLLATNNMAAVLQNATEMERLSLAVKDVAGIAYAYFFKASYYLQIKRYNNAKEFAIKNIRIIKENQLKGSIETDAYLLLSDIGLATGNLEMFNANRQKSDSLQDFYTSGKILKYTQELQAKYALDKKQAEISTLVAAGKIQELTIKKRNAINTALAGLAGIVIVISALLYHSYRQKNKILRTEDIVNRQRINQLEKEKQLLAAEYVLQGQDEERKRLAKDLHDGLGGILSSAKFSFINAKSHFVISPANAADFERGMNILDKSITELRRVAHNMMPESLLNYGLDTAVKEFCNSIGQTGSLKLTCQSFGINDETVTKNKASVIYRIIQELVNNILKHANAQNALVQLILNNGLLHITVEDDGYGFDTSLLTASSGMGFASLQNRVNYLTGTMDIVSSPGNGTSINIDIPYII